MCHTWDRGETCTGFWWESPKGDHLEDRGVDARTGIRTDLGETGWKGVDWIHLAQNRNRWRAVVNEVMNLSGSCTSEFFC
jgi:hypothetical protein